MDLTKVITIYATMFIMINVVVYATVPHHPFAQELQINSLTDLITNIPNIVKIVGQFILFPLTNVLPMLYSEFPLMAVLYAIITIPAYIGIFYLFTQALFWIIGKLLS